MKRTAIRAITVIAVFSACVCAVFADKTAVKTEMKRNDFGYKMFSEICASEKDKNVFISPYSISCAMAMAYEGAKKETAAQMQKAMSYPSNIADLRKDFSGMQAFLNAGSKEYQLASANSLWPQAGWGFLPAYMLEIKNTYGGNAEEVDYSLNKADAIYRINKWTASKTRNKIPEIVDEDSVNELTRMVLVNAIYFKGSWLTKFDEKETKKSDFKGIDKTVKADMMNITASYRYAEQDGVQALELPYKGMDIYMLAILPKERSTGALVKSLDYGAVKKLQDAMTEQKVYVSLPKFTVNCLYSLKKPLAKLGIKDAFDEKLADFSGMTGKKDLYISDVIHGSFVDVNEEGTEAAAATAVVMGLKSIYMDMPPEFIADHPFIFLICDRRSGSVLFMGRINDPAGKEDKK